MARQLLDLPFDVVLRLWSYMNNSTQVAFVCTCKALYETHVLAIPFKRFQQHVSKGPVLLALAPQRMLVRRLVKYMDFPKPKEDDGRCTNDLCDDDSEALMVVGSSKQKRSVREDWVIVEPRPEKPYTLEQPFVVSRVAYTSDKSDILLHVVFPDYRINDHTVEVVATRSHIGFSLDFEQAFRRRYYLDRSSKKKRRLEEHGPFSYKAILASTGYTFQRLNNARIWRTWYMAGCGECGGDRTICPGCGGLSRRWPEAFTSCTFDLPCPLCVGYDAAIEGVYYVRANDQRSIDEQLNIACVNRKTWTKKGWEMHLKRKEESKQAKQAKQHVVEGLVDDPCRTA
ncbi:hypothetical protein EXIGLDRAFT_752577 [Exidia glandulosa HHB12029]|uniref:F-box domain-containing protein n=1 Tax=Exidia glandulosa HHB12029 TaxID=1314781 RepID=A0A165ZYJ7_EXIGL|nr:hypothetical protein EXIGLDRAFT_752577 [Exidia glandulosa HHB12029]